MFKDLIQKLFFGKKIHEEEIAKTKQQAKEIVLEANEEALKIKQEAEK